MSSETPIQSQASTSSTLQESQSAPSEQSMSITAAPASSPPQQKSTSVSGNTPKQSTLSRRQHAAQRARILALSKQLKTRLQYATFKVEHGWSKQSLSEVENLYYRHYKGSGTSTSAPGTSNQGSTVQISPSSRRKSNMPSTPSSNARVGSVNTATPDANNKTSMGTDSEVFGGLITPPASGGNFASQIEKEAFTNNPSFASGLRNQRRSPTAGLEGKNAATNKGKSYADFWSKIGTANPNQAVERS